MSLLILCVLALQAGDPAVAQDTSPSFAQSDGATEGRPDVPMKKHKKKKQDPPQEPPGAARPTPEDLQRKPKREDYDPAFRAGMTLEYNDNIIRLDKKDVTAFEDGTNPEKFRIQSRQDWIYSPWAESDLAMSDLGDSGRAGLRFTGYIYQINSFATHGALTAFLKSKSYTLEYTYEPGIYRREYRNLDTGIYESAFYDDHLLEGSVKIRLSDQAIFRPKVGVEIRDYDAPFRYRTSFAPFVAPRVTFAFLNELQPFFQYDFEYNQAIATGLQPDTSYYQNGVEAGLLSKLDKTVQLEVKYRAEYRVYTTSNSALVDPSHSGRTDLRTRLVAGATWKALSSLSIEATYIRGVVDSDVPGKPDLSNEESDWRRNQYLLGFTYVF
jgi:hypothetical protein